MVSCVFDQIRETDGDLPMVLCYGSWCLHKAATLFTKSALSSGPEDTLLGFLSCVFF